MVLDKTLESPLDSKEIKSVNPKGNQSWMSIGRTDAKAEAPILWPPDARSRLIRKDTDAGRDWRQEEKETMRRGWDGWMALKLNGHEFDRALGEGEGQRSLACCSPWSCKESDTNEWLNNNSNIRSHRPCLIIPSHWAFGFQHMNFLMEHKHKDHISNIYLPVSLFEREYRWLFVRELSVFF